MAKKLQRREEETVEESPEVSGFRTEPTDTGLPEGALRLTIEGKFNGVVYSESVAMTKAEQEKFGLYTVDGLEVKLRRLFNHLMSHFE